MTDELFKYIVQRLLESEKVESRGDSDFKDGRRLGYYEVIDIIQSELKIHGLSLKDFGLDFKAEKLL